MAESRHNKYELEQYQSLSLDSKIRMSQQRIRQWYDYWDGNVCVSFSGGKDSTVLLHLIRELYPDIPAVFADTGLEYPEIRKFAIAQDNVNIVRPKMIFSEVISTYGYPLISKEVAQITTEARTARQYSRVHQKFDSESEYVKKYGNAFDCSKWLPLVYLPVPISHKCCFVMKKQPLAKFKNIYVGTMAEESALRRTQWIRYGCNAFDMKKPRSAPLSFWTEQDVLRYALENKIKICSVYGDIVYTDEDGNEYQASDMTVGKLKCSGCQRTGCVFCGFGAHLDKESRFKRLAKTHPRLYEYCMNGGQWVDNPRYDSAKSEYIGKWKNYNPKKIWVPSKQGLGMKKVFDMINEEYGRMLINY